MRTTIRLQREEFDAAAEAGALTHGRTDIGALVTFTGICRGAEAGEPIAALTLEHYPGMAEAEIGSHVEEAKSRWPLLGVTVIHRYGRIAPGENIVLVVTASSHREAAFAAAEFLMDYLKTRAPFWKQVESRAGKAWVEAKGADDAAAARWQKLSERLGAQFVIENRPGAGGILASKAGATAAPDGYTLTLTGNGSAISKSLFKSLPYDVLRDFKSVSVMAWLDLTIATKAGGPLRTVKDIIAAAKRNPGKLNFGTIAPGSTQNLSAQLFRLTADIKVTVVTFRTTPDLITALLRGDIDVGFDYLAGFRASLNENQLRAVATTGEKRSPSTPDVPTVSESGMPDYVVTSWNAVSAPAGTPDDIVNFLSKEIREALKSPDIQSKALQFGLDARGTTPEEMQARMRADIVKWAAVIEKAGLEKQ